MSFASVSSLSFTDATGTSWTADFEVWNAASESNTFRVLEGERTVGDERSHPFNPILGAMLHTRVYDESRTLHDKILANANEDIRVTVKKGGTIWHQGLLDRVVGGDELRRSNPELRLSWNDGLAYLKSQRWNEQGRGTLLEFLAYLLSESTRTDLPTRVAIAWADANADTTNGQSRALQHDLSRQMGSGTFWDVLLQTLRFYNLQLFQEDGKWWVLHRSYRDSGQSYSWEERDAAGNESSGTTNPTVSLADSDWTAENRPNADDVTRPTVEPDGWRGSFQIANVDFQNQFFQTSTTDAFSGNTVPVGWDVTAASIFDDAADQIQITAGLESTDPNYAEQILDRRMARTDGAKYDRIDVELSGDADIKSDTEESNDIVVGRLEAIDRDGNIYYRDTNVGWTSTETYLTVTVSNPSSGTSTESWTLTMDDIRTPNQSAGEEVYYFRFRLYMDEDPDDDGTEECAIVRWDKCEITARSDHTDRDLDGGVTHEMVISGDVQSEKFSIGSDLRDTPTGGIRYDDGTVWKMLHQGSAGLTHVGRASYSTTVAEDNRIRDRYSQASRQLFRIFGLIDRSTINVRDTLTYDSRDWLPSYWSESIRKEKVRVGVTELRNDDPSGFTVDEMSGVDESRGIQNVTGIGASGVSGAASLDVGKNQVKSSTGGGGGGSGVDSWQTRTGAVEFASEDAGPGLEIDTSADPNEIQIGQPITDTDLTIAKDSSDYFVARITSDSDRTFFRLQDSGPNDLGVMRMRGLDGAGNGYLTFESFDSVRTDVNWKIGDLTVPNAPLHVAGNSRIEGSMHVGGDSAPSETLHVAGNGHFQGASSRIEARATAAGSFDFAFLRLKETDTSEFWDIAQKVSTEGLQFRPSGGSPPVVFMPGGNAGFGGETSPSFDVDASSVIRAQTRFRSPETRTDATFSAGWTGSGWKMSDSQNGKSDALELSNLVVRETLRVFELEVRDIAFTRGPLGVTPGGGKLEDVASSSHTAVSNTFTSATKQTWTFENKNNDSTKPGLSQGDRLLAQRFDPSTQNVVTQVRAVVDETSSQNAGLSAYQFNVSVDDAFTVPTTGADTEGYEFIVNASSNTGRDSFLYFDPYAPAGSAFDGVSDFDDWDARADLIRYRWGRLDSWYDYGSSANAYGMAAGDPNGTWVGIDDNNGMRVFTGGTTKMIEFTTGGSGFIRDILQVGSLVFIGENVGTLDAPTSAIVGPYSGSTGDPHFKARGPDTGGGANFVQMVGRSASSDAVFRVDVDGTTMMDILPDDGVSLYDSTGTRTIHFDTAGDVFVANELLMGSSGVITISTGEFTFDQDGLDLLSEDVVLHGSPEPNNISWTDSGNTRASLSATNTGRMSIRADTDIVLSLGGSELIVNTDEVSIADPILHRNVLASTTTPSTPASGLKIYAKEDSDGFTRPVYVRDNGDEFFLDTGNAV